ncbi:helix-turn-helix transcriptional regulator [Teichococcus aestuarii]|uniref:helix-turn-helix transcriptional regulator n=1 Tax=Teichococcus aestuarii TaxID=568898 RepID=UPI0036177A4E
MPEDRLDALIDDLYGLAADGGSSESGWEALLARVALLMGATSAALQLASPQQGTTRLLATHNVADAVNQDYAAHFFPRDIFMDQARAMPGQLMLSQDHLPDALVAQSEIYNDLFRHHLHGAFYVAGGVTPVGDGQVLGFGLQRARERGAFTAEESRTLQRLWPHLRRAAQVQLRLQQAEVSQRLGFEALDRMTGGIVILAADRRILFMNRAARRLLEERSGCATTGNGGRLRLTYGPADERFSLLLAQATTMGPPRRANTLRCPRAEGLPALMLLVAPFQPQTMVAMPGAAPLALLLISDPRDVPPPLPDQLMALFGLTPAEAGVAASLAQGLSPEEVAQAREVRLSTVRSQVQALLAKTGTRRQGELLRLLLSLPQAAAPD